MHNDNTNIQVIVYFIVVGFFVTLLKMILIRLNTDTFFIITHKRHPHPPLLTFILTKSSYVFLHLEHFYMDIHLLFIFSSISLIFSQNKQFLQKIFHSKGMVDLHFWHLYLFNLQLLDIIIMQGFFFCIRNFINCRVWNNY